MIDRINLILKAKNITARQFAEEIGIQPSGMSHILGGRNNPSLDFVTKVIRRYPEIDANWLLMGRGSMIGGGGVQHDEGGVNDTESNRKAVGSPAPPVVVSSSLFPEYDDSPASAQPVEPVVVGPMAQVQSNSSIESPAPTLGVAEASACSQTNNAVPHEELLRSDVQYLEEQERSVNRGSQYSTKIDVSDCRRIVRLLFIYNDGTFEECLPANKS